MKPFVKLSTFSMICFVFSLGSPLSLPFLPFLPHHLSLFHLRSAYSSPHILKWVLNFLKPAREAKKAGVAGVEGRKQWPEKRGRGAQVLVSLNEGVVSTGVERRGHRV